MYPTNQRSLLELVEPVLPATVMREMRALVPVAPLMEPLTTFWSSSLIYQQVSGETATWASVSVLSSRTSSWPSTSRTTLV